MTRDNEVELHRIRCHIDRLLAERGMTVTELTRRGGITNVNMRVTQERTCQVNPVLRTHRDLRGLELRILSVDR